MEPPCAGCQWIDGEIDSRRQLAREFERNGDYRWAQIAQEGIASLTEDRQAHAARDHHTPARPSPTTSNPSSTEDPRPLIAIR